MFSWEQTEHLLPNKKLEQLDIYVKGNQLGWIFNVIFIWQRFEDMFLKLFLIERKEKKWYSFSFTQGTFLEIRNWLFNWFLFLGLKTPPHFKYITLWNKYELFYEKKIWLAFTTMTKLLFLKYIFVFRLNVSLE